MASNVVGNKPHFRIGKSINGLRSGAGKRIAIGLTAVALLAIGVSAGTAASVNAAADTDFSYTKSTFTVSPVANLSNKDTWVVANGVDAYTGTLTAIDRAGNKITDLKTEDIRFTATGTRIVIGAVVNHHDGTYTATYTSKKAQRDSTASVWYRGVQLSQGKPPVVCTELPAITEFVPDLNSVTYDNKPLPTLVKDGKGQVVTYNPAVWASLGYYGATPQTMPVKVKGTGQPGTTVTVTGDNALARCTATVGADGKWQCTMPLGAFPLPKLQWTTLNLKTGLLYEGDGYSAWQTFRVSGDCGDGASIRVGSGYTTPLAIDFSGTGKIETLSPEEFKGTFAWGPGGESFPSGWLAPSAGFLVRDLNNNGKVDGLNELFGGAIGDGYAALTTYDTNKDGVIDSKDAGYAKLSVWRDLNSDGVTNTGELKSLSASGVTSISVSHSDHWEYDAKGNAAYEHGSAVVSGSTVTMNDVYFSIQVGTDRPIPFKAGPADHNPPPCEDPTMKGTLFSVAPTSLGINEQATMTAYVSDKYCNPVENEPVTFAATGSATVTPAAPVLTNADGVATAKVTDARPETVSVSGTIADGELNGSPVRVSFTGAGDFDYDKSFVTVTPVPDPDDRATWAVADGVDRYTVILTAIDTFGNPMPSLTLSDIQFLNSNPRVTISAITNNHDGTYTAYCTSLSVTWSADMNAYYKAKMVGDTYQTLFA